MENKNQLNPEIQKALLGQQIKEKEIGVKVRCVEVARDYIVGTAHYMKENANMDLITLAKEIYNFIK